MKTNQKTTKPRMIATNYEKKFETLKQMVEELKTLHPEMSNIFADTDYPELYPCDLMANALGYFNENMPNIVDKVNLPVSLSVNASKVILKTCKFFTLAWKFFYDENGFVTDIVTTITTFTKEKGRINEDLEAMCNMINNQENGWAIIENNR